MLHDLALGDPFQISGWGGKMTKQLSGPWVWGRKQSGFENMVLKKQTNHNDKQKGIKRAGKKSTLICLMKHLLFLLAAWPTPPRTPAKCSAHTAGMCVNIYVYILITRGGSNSNSRFFQQQPILFHYQPPYLFWGASKQNKQKTTLGQKRNSSWMEKHMLEPSWHRLLVISAFLRSATSLGLHTGLERNRGYKDPCRPSLVTRTPACAAEPGEMDWRSGKARPTRDPAHCEIRPFPNCAAIQSLAYIEYVRMSIL